MAQVFKDMRQEAQRRGGEFGLTRLWVRTLLDLAATAFVERSKAMRWKFLMPLALVLGLLIALVDSSPGWDDTAVSAAAIFTSCGILGAIHPRRAWQWALAVGLWIPVLGIALQPELRILGGAGGGARGSLRGEAGKVRHPRQSVDVPDLRW